MAVSDQEGRYDESLDKLLLKSVKDYAIFRLTADGAVASWTRGAESIKGYTPEEIVGRHFSVFFTPEDQAAGKPASLLRRAASEGRVEDQGWRVRKDGSRFWADVIITALEASPGKVVGYAKITRDLTERHRNEVALRHRERQLLETQRLANLGSWEWNVATDHVTWTEEMYQIFGLDPDTFGATFDAYLAAVHPDDRDRVRMEIQAALEDPRAFTFEERIVRPDGEVRTVRTRGHVVVGDDGRILRFNGACLDITDLKEAEEQAIQLAREQTARAAAEKNAAGLRFLLRASEILASSLDCEVTLKNVTDLAVAEISDWCAVDLVKGKNRLERVAVSHPDPSKVELARRYMERFPPKRDGKGGMWSVVDTGEPVFYPDISDEALVDGISDPDELALARTVGIHSAIIVPLIGTERVLGTLTLVQTVSERKLTEFDLSIARQLGRHAALAIENASLHRELEEQHSILSDTMAELEQQAEELQNQAIHLEELMTELEVANEELRHRTKEAEAANRVKSDFLATMSHELRTPLNAIFGHADLLDLGLHGPVNDAQREALDRIKRNQRALLALINDILNFARLEAGKLELHITDVDLCEVIADLEPVIGPQVMAKQMRYEWSGCDPKLKVRGERERIEQILLNLLGNAIKFTEEGGSIVLDTEADDESVRLIVSDTGRGIPPDRLKSIFDPFVQLDRSRDESVERGVGLGLAISQDLAEAMGGDLSAESVVGKGSTFTLTLSRVT